MDRMSGILRKNRSSGTANVLRPFPVTFTLEKYRVKSRAWLESYGVTKGRDAADLRPPTWLHVSPL